MYSGTRVSGWQMHVRLEIVVNQLRCYAWSIAGQKLCYFIFQTKKNKKNYSQGIYRGIKIEIK